MDSAGFVRKRKGSDSGTAGEVPGSVSVTASDVSEVKAHLFKQLREPIGTTSSGSDSAPSSSSSSSSSGRPSVEETKMKTILDSCFQEKVSGSVLVIGSAGSGKRQFADRILSAYKTPSGEAVKVARLQGLAFTKDNHALISLAKQVGIFADTDNFNMSVEALQSHFQQSRLQSVPTVILIEDIDEFTKGSRQVLLYTLLDLMHRNDLYFVVVGISHRVDITSLLEKRVISRLSAQCVYLRPKNAQEIKEILVDKLIISSKGYEDGSSSGTPICKKSKVSTPSGVRSVLLENRSDQFSNYIELFNSSVKELFGPRPLKSIIEKSSAPLITDLISRNVSWGKDIAFFVSVLKLAVSRLSPQNPFLTHNMLADCFSQMQLPDMESIITSLPMVELYLLIAAIRLHIRHCGGNSPGADPILQKDGSRVLKVKGAGGFSVDLLLQETEKLTGLLRKKVVMKRQIFAAVASLAENSKLISLSNGKQFHFAKFGSVCQVLETSQVTLCASLVEFRATFRSRSLHISDKLRKAVLEPLEPLTYGGVMPTAEGESSNLNSMIQLVS